MAEPKDILIAARKAKGLTQEEFAVKLGLSHRMYQRYEEGLFPKYKTATIVSIDKLLGTNLYDAIYDKEIVSLAESEINYIRKRRDIKNGGKPAVPVYGGFTTLGNIEILDDANIKHKVVAELPGDIFPGCNYAEKAKGDSMYPLIMNQALLVGKTCPVQGIIFGEKYIIKTRNGMDTTKFIHPGADPGKLKLKAYNKSIPDQEIDSSEIVFCCRVHWIINPT